MRAHWITTHYPHDADDKWFVYLTAATRRGGVPARGDLILFYQTAERKRPGALVCASEVVADEPSLRVPPKGQFRFEIACAEPADVANRPVLAGEMLDARKRRA